MIIDAARRLNQVVDAIVELMFSPNVTHDPELKHLPRLDRATQLTNGWLRP
jgi:hypothetical protein